MTTLSDRSSILLISTTYSVEVENFDHTIRALTTDGQGLRPQTYSPSSYPLTRQECVFYAYFCCQIGIILNFQDKFCNKATIVGESVPALFFQRVSFFKFMHAKVSVTCILIFARPRIVAYLNPCFSFASAKTLSMVSFLCRQISLYFGIQRYSSVFYK